jgi:formylglycine-generating enzyme required for sulfatase activity
MVPYQETIPGTDVQFTMLPIPGGEFLLGSPADEAERKDDEGPQVQVTIAPFWMGKCEVTWAEYRSYMACYQAFKRLQQLRGQEPPANAPETVKAEWNVLQQHGLPPGAAARNENEVDAVTSPTPLYDSSYTYGAGEADDQPAVTMTHFAARQYTKWLSRLTGRQFRLPTEAEWEYAARAGSTTAYSFGDDPAELEQYAWYDDNADYETHPVGTKAPNAWGLHDMHGNAAEWTLDQYHADAYERLAPGPVDAAAAVQWPEELYPRVIRGGCWFDTAEWLRSAARHRSEEDEWKLSDPNAPLSPWWYTEDPSMGVGMRLVRPLAPLASANDERLWEADVEDLRFDVETRLDEGRGALGIADPDLPRALELLQQLDR